ncbi:uncharacterized protein LOC121393436 [Xenopus laevis]|uniref:non-specific serine/threonine protein kinase n=1 Tax=Xenopus laevis TaxID=8355 RepID=A0A8J1KKL4_XENLA|nr:uncharacterized protein LOC121393436 [Xenopus laevis]
MDDERKEKETNEKTETSKGLGFIVFRIFGILQQVVESINPYSWVPSEKESVESIEVDIKEVQEKKIPQRKRKADDVCEDEPAPQKKRTEAGGLSAIVPSSAIEWIQSKVSSCISQASQYASRWWESIKPFIPLANQGTKRQRSEAEKFEENVSKRRKIETKKDEKKRSIPCARKRIMREIQGIQQRNTAKEPVSSRRATAVETNLSINRFKIYGELGSGSFGQVLLAKDQLKEKYVALKRIRKNRFTQSIADVRIEQTILVVAQECRFLTRLNAIFETTVGTILLTIRGTFTKGQHFPCVGLYFRRNIRRVGEEGKSTGERQHTVSSRLMYSSYNVASDL